MTNGGNGGFTAVPPAPKEGIVARLQRCWRSRRVTTKFALATLVPLCVVGLVSAWQTWKVTDSWMVTVEIGINTTSAHQANAGIAGEALAVTGFLFVPALAGLVVGRIWERVREPKQ